MKGLLTQFRLHTLSFTTSHFSTWNLDWHYSSSCSTTKIDFKGRFNALFVRILDLETQQYLSYGHLVTKSDPMIQLQNAPANRPVQIVAYSVQDEQGYFQCGNSIWHDVAGTETVSDLCGGDIVVEVNTAGDVPQASLTLITVDVELYCPDGKVVLRPNGVLYLHDSLCDSYQYLGTMKSGHLEVENLIQGETYGFSFFYDKEEYQFSIQVDADSYEFSEELPELCP